MTRRPDDQFPLLLSVNEAAEYMGVGKDFIYRDLHSINPPRHIRDGKRFLISRDHLREYYDKKMYGIR